MISPLFSYKHQPYCSASCSPAELASSLGWRAKSNDLFNQSHQPFFSTLPYFTTFTFMALSPLKPRSVSKLTVSFSLMGDIRPLLWTKILSPFEESLMKPKPLEVLKKVTFPVLTAPEPWLTEPKLEEPITISSVLIVVFFLVGSGGVEVIFPFSST